MIRAWLLSACCVALLAVSSTGHEPPAAAGPRLLLAKTDTPAAGQSKTAKLSETTALAGVTTYDQLSALAKKQNCATAIVALYKRFLKDAKVAKAEKDLARQDLAHWQELADQGAVRLGGKWLTAAQLEEMRQAEEQLVREATKLFETDNDDLAQEKLLAAARANPLAYIPHFLLGLHHAITKRNSQAAELDFTECVKRLKRIETPTHSQRASLRAALNNLAITEARHKKHAAALKHWKEATDERSVPVELVQNVGRFVYLAKAMPLLAIPKDAEKSAGNLFATLAVHSKKQSFREHIGWLYLSYFDPDEKKKEEPAHPSDPPPPGAQPPPEQLVPVSFGTGFVVQPGHIVTNHHVVDGADGLEIHTRRNQAVTHSGRVLAVSPVADIALVECKDLEAAPVPFCTDPPRLAADVLVLGYPEMQIIGTDLKVVKGVISGLPDPAVESFLLYDAQVNHGSSGGPVCDQRGRAVALNAAVFQLENKISAGVPAAHVLEFLKKELPTFQQPPAAATALDWSDIAEKVGESTVLILNLQSPAKVHAITKRAPKRKDAAADHIALEDPWCMICGGSGHLDCPNCTRGANTVMNNSVAAINPITGERTVVSTPTKAACRRCGGKGHVNCTHCFGGIDPTVMGAKPR